MDLLNVFILAIVEGITEFLPISSTGHLILTSNILSIPSSAFLKTFEIAIQLGAILAVIFLYRKKLIKEKSLNLKILAGFVPTGIIGFAFYPIVKNLLDSEIITVVALFIGGIAIIGIEWYFKRKPTTYNLQPTTLIKITYKQSFLIGLIQSISMIPGVSRSAASIFGGMALKLDRKSAVEFSFLLAIPTMIVATGFELIKYGSNYTETDSFYLLLGITGSFITALVVIKWLLKYVQKNDFIGFGIYRIVFAIIYFLLFVK